MDESVIGNWQIGNRDTNPPSLILQKVRKKMFNFFEKLNISTYFAHIFRMSLHQFTNLPIPNSQPTTNL
jgi:hypothetical protein